MDDVCQKLPMVIINEIMPNPDGKDAGQEWIELYNSGTQNINLAGWRLENGAGKKLNLSGEIGGGNFLTVKASGSFILRNTGEKVFMYDSGGRLAQEARFLGAAPSGKSWSRLPAGSFIWAEPTPGKENSQTGAVAIVENAYPIGQVLNSRISGWDVGFLLLGTAGILTAALLFIIKRNENLSKLFFGGN